jgi:hypothetical protein
MKPICAATLAVLVSLSLLAGAAAASPDAMLSIVSVNGGTESPNDLLRQFEDNHTISLSDLHGTLDHSPAIANAELLQIHDMQELVLRLQVANTTSNQTQLRSFDDTVRDELHRVAEEFRSLFF